MFVDISAELSFKTSRSGGAGGQNVNKVETAVEATWNPGESQLFTDQQKELILAKTQHLLTKEGLIKLRSQTHRTQLANKEEVMDKFNLLIAKALVKKKARIATKPGKAAQEKRLDSKKRNSSKKQNRRQDAWES